MSNLPSSGRPNKLIMGVIYVHKCGTNHYAMQLAASEITKSGAKIFTSVNSLYNHA